MSDDYSTLPVFDMLWYITRCTRIVYNESDFDDASLDDPLKYGNISKMIGARFKSGVWKGLGPVKNVKQDLSLEVRVMLMSKPPQTKFLNKLVMWRFNKLTKSFTWIITAQRCCLHPGGELYYLKKPAVPIRKRWTLDASVLVLTAALKISSSALKLQFLPSITSVLTVEKAETRWVWSTWLLGRMDVSILV